MCTLPRTSDYAKTFLRIGSDCRFDLNRRKEAITLLVVNDGALATEWLDHPLKKATGCAFGSAMSAEISC